MDANHNPRIPKLQALLPPMTKRIETRVCQCGKEFQTAIYSAKGKDGIGHTLCKHCEWQLREEEIKEEIAKIHKAYLESRKVVLRESLPKKYRTATFSSYDQTLQPAAYVLFNEYNNRSVIMSSPNIWGVGKTHLVCALLNRIIDTLKPNDKGRIATPFYFTTETDLSLRIRNTFSNNNQGENEESIYNEIKSYPLLVIDDIGKTAPFDLSFLQRVFFRVINDRYTDGTPIIVTTNLGVVPLGNYIGNACADRLVEMCGKGNVLTMRGESYRQRAVQE